MISKNKFWRPNWNNLNLKVTKWILINPKEIRFKQIRKNKQSHWMKIKVWMTMNITLTILMINSQKLRNSKTLKNPIMSIRNSPQKIILNQMLSNPILMRILNSRKKFSQSCKAKHRIENPMVTLLVGNLLLKSKIRMRKWVSQILMRKEFNSNSYKRMLRTHSKLIKTWKKKILNLFQPHKNQELLAKSLEEELQQPLEAQRVEGVEELLSLLSQSCKKKVNKRTKMLLW